jgi:hypothetical protein
MSAGNGGERRTSPWRIVRWCAPAVLLLVPLVAMQFTEEVTWTAFDFIWASVVLWGAVLTYELIASRGDTTVYRTAVGVAVMTALVLTWINGAVGVIGDGPINLLYVGVPLVGMIAAILGRFEPLGLARACLAMAGVQMTIPVVALTVWYGGWQALLSDDNSPHPPFDPGILPVFVLNGVFAMLFIGAAALFREAALRSFERSSS